MNSPRSAQSSPGDTTAAMSTSSNNPGAPSPSVPPGRLPLLADAADPDGASALVASLRRFHLTGSADGLALVDADLLPALLAPFRNISRVRYDYPLFLCPMPGSEELYVKPLATELETWLSAFAISDGKARILRDNLPRVERFVRRTLEEQASCANARDILAKASTALKAELDLSGDHAQALDSDLASLLEQVPEAGQILGFREDAAVYLLLAAAWAALPPRRAAFLTEIDKLARQLDELLRVERTKAPAARDAQAVQRSLGSAGSIDPAVLAATIGPHRGSARTSPERIKRIEAAVDTLRGFASRAEEQPLLTVVHDGALSQALAEDPTLDVIRDDQPCDAVSGCFDRVAAEMAEVFRAVRTARLEVADNYDRDRHDPWLAELTWEAFSLTELLLVRPVVALPSARSLSGPGLLSLSRLLRSARPIKVVVSENPAGEPEAGGDTTQLGSGVRFELGYFGISHREALVHSTAVSQPDHLLRGLRRTLTSTRPALHVVASTTSLDGEQPTLGGWLHNGAAIEGRAHPMFCYDPAPGATWARRFDFDGNPSPESDWPASTLAYRTDQEEQSVEVFFTFADFALLEPAYRQHFRAVPPGVPLDDLVTVADYLELDDEDAARQIPYIWAVDGEGSLIRVALTRRLAFACRDRLSYWRTLQELSGVRNEHVQQAVARARKEAEAEAEAKIAELTDQHDAELDRVRNDTAAESMQRLAAALLDTDLSTLTAAPAPAAPVAPTPTPAANPEAEAAPQSPAPEPAAEAEDDDMGLDEAWIDTPLCTSCNDCLAINPLTFVYDENKQAVIGDASAATFEQLVRAAEKCPARCIHPGKPTNPGEANLEDLLKRAEPFN